MGKRRTKLKILMDKHNLSQRMVVDGTGVPKSTVHGVLHGQRNPSLLHARRLVYFFYPELTYEDLGPKDGKLRRIKPLEVESDPNYTRNATGSSYQAKRIREMLGG